PDRCVVLRDPGVAAEDRLADHRGPFDLEQERELAAEVPRAVDLGDLVRGTVDVDEGHPQLALVEPIHEAARAEAAGLLPPADPDRQAEAMAPVGEERDQL